MIRKKVYGEYKQNKCPLCGAVATINNSQGIPFCQSHRKETLENMKCSCGSFLDLKKGKYGPFFACMKCGLVSFSKALSVNGYPLKSIHDI